MNHLTWFLAQVDTSDILDAEKRFMGPRTYEFLLIFGSFTAAIVLGGVWAVYYSMRRRKRRHRHRHHHSSTPEISRQTSGDDREDEPAEPSNRKKRRRRRHRPMNPTLAQTGGLPPIRDKNTPPQGL